MSGHPPGILSLSPRVLQCEEYIGIDASRDYLDLSLRTRLAQGALIEGDTP